MSSQLVVDSKACMGCKICELMCSLKHSGEFNPSQALLRIIKNPLLGLYYPETCKQCATPACYYACPIQGAIEIDKATGARIINKDKCIACKRCYEACLLNIIAYNSVENFYMKCDLCGGTPICVEFCSTKAIRYQPRE